MALQRLHLWFGVVFLAVFLATGLAMTLHVPALDERSSFERLLFRSRHIYLLGAACLNVVLGLYCVQRQGASLHLQRLGSLVVLSAPVLALIGFFRDPIGVELDNAPWGHFAAYAMFGGTLAHLLSAIRWNTPRG